MNSNNHETVSNNIHEIESLNEISNVIDLDPNSLERISGGEFCFFYINRDKKKKLATETNQQEQIADVSTLSL